MTATYTFDIFTSLDGFGGASGDWGGYWGKQGPELLDRRLALYSEKQRLVLGANTFRLFSEMFAAIGDDTESLDAWDTQLHEMPTTVVSNTLTMPLDWPDATLVPGDAVDVVAS